MKKTKKKVRYTFIRLLTLFFTTANLLTQFWWADRWLPVYNFSGLLLRLGWIGFLTALSIIGVICSARCRSR